ncbi:hypothetical protein QZM12_33275, partial [Burkholderia cepacia]|nr:hypothetical protein [Burkholderia cepacia]
MPWVEPGKGLNLDSELIKQLVPGTLDRATINEQLAALKKAIFERAGGAIRAYPKLCVRGINWRPRSHFYATQTQGRSDDRTGQGLEPGPGT